MIRAPRQRPRTRAFIFGLSPVAATFASFASFVTVMIVADAWWDPGLPAAGLELEEMGGPL